MASTLTAKPVTQQRGGLRRVLVTLCATETTSWGILYYAFPVLAGQISADTGWSLTRLTAAFSLGLVVSAVLGIAVGQWLDRHGPRWLMTGSALAAVSTVGVGLAPTFGWFVTAWAVSGVAMSAVLYPLAVSLPTMLVAFARYSRDASFAVLGENRWFLLTMAAGSIAGTLLGGLLLGVVPSLVLVPLLVALLLVSAVKVWQHQ